MLTWPPRATRRRMSVGIAGAAVIAGCANPSPAPPPGAPAPPQSAPAPRPEAPAGLVPVTIEVPDGLGGAPFDSPREALVPDGWTMSVWARILGARLTAWTPDGALLVSVPRTGQMMRLTPSADGGAADMSAMLEGLYQPHGLAFDGQTLYVAETNQVVAYDYAGGRARNQRVIAPGLPSPRSPELKGAYGHALKSVAIGSDGAVYFSIGSTGNITAEDLDANPPRASIMRVPPGGGPAELFAPGVRNGTGLAIAPDGSVWTAVNGRDDIAYPYDRPYGDDPESSLGKVIPEYVAEHPPEQLARLTPGRNLGWPYCETDADVDPGVAGSPQESANVGFVRDIETNADGSKLDCSTLAPVEQTFSAHSAPLGLSFVDGGLPEPYARGALAGVHGSWNRTSPRAPEVSFFPWQNGTLGNQQTLVGGFQSTDGSRWGRPVAAVAGPDGALYITDDDADAVYRLAPPGR